ncbi:MAG: NAD(P)-dependent dehydrogenase, short-chain alcohol dehydrogenase family [Chloroflexi bacterium]|jgi:NAD(P)-dependent dehydrogenase (short-subunit alcohol dehydrogenase family)|nr:MAG: NAD(P)-dependent dehydrogenase, short-chain alcohol dehydrogenase family [Chloroflexota bacterium]
MELDGKVTIITGGASGIGRGICHAFAAQGATVVAVDLNADGVAETATQIGGTAMTANVAEAEDIQRVVDQTIAQFGRVDLMFSNAGVSLGPGRGASGVDLLGDDADWAKSWAVNTLAHLYAARAVLPHMLERGQGYICSTASAAGLLTSLGSASYAITKHGAVAFAEYLSMTYGSDGITVSCLCPLGVDTPMLKSDAERSALGRFLSEAPMQPDMVADVVVQAIRDETFLILPHPEVREFVRRKADDHDRWLRGMRRLWTNMQEMSARRDSEG